MSRPDNMERLFDIHCHIVPAIDDGVQTIEEALALIGKEVEGGTQGFVATPHVYTEDDCVRSPQIPERVAALREAVAGAGIPVEIHAGAEVYPGMHVVTAVDAGMPLTAGGHGRHMLVDLPMSTLPMDFGTLIFELRARGITPIIAHPERCGTFQQEPEKIREFLDNGAACQINAGSLRGKYGPVAKDVAWFYLNRHWPHFLATDAHRPRPEPILRKTADRLAGRLDNEYLRLITTESGRCIAHGEDLPALPAPTRQDAGDGHGWLASLFGKKTQK